jgi:hypothetical protein
VPAPSRPVRVTLGGKDVRFVWKRAPFPGVVLRLHGPTLRGEVVLHEA